MQAPLALESGQVQEGAGNTCSPRDNIPLGAANSAASRRNLAFDHLCPPQGLGETLTPMPWARTCCSCPQLSSVLSIMGEGGLLASQLAGHSPPNPLPEPFTPTLSSHGSASRSLPRPRTVAAPPQLASQTRQPLLPPDTGCCQPGSSRGVLCGLVGAHTPGCGIRRGYGHPHFSLHLHDSQGAAEAGALGGLQGWAGKGARLSPLSVR